MQNLFDYLLQLLNIRSLDHFLTLEEHKRMPVFRMTKWTRALAVLGGLEFVFTLPGCWIPFVYWIWRFPGVLASSTVISREVENRTWHPLIVTPLTIRDIVMNKYAAVFRYMETQITLVSYVRAVPVVIFAATWIGSTLTVLPQRGLPYWLVTSLALFVAGVYLMASPLLDVAVDGALGVLASSLSQRRSTALIMAVLARLSLWLLPLAMAVPLQFSLLPLLSGGSAPDQFTMHTASIVANFGPGYAFFWSNDPLLSIALVVLFFVARLGVVRLLLEIAIFRTARSEV